MVNIVIITILLLFRTLWSCYKDDNFVTFLPPPVRNTSKPSKVGSTTLSARKLLDAELQALKEHMWVISLHFFQYCGNWVKKILVYPWWILLTTMIIQSFCTLCLVVLYIYIYIYIYIYTHTHTYIYILTIRVRMHPGIPRIYFILIPLLESLCFSIHPWKKHLKRESTLNILKTPACQGGSFDQTSSMDRCENQLLYSTGIPNMMSIFLCFSGWCLLWKILG